MSQVQPIDANSHIYLVDASGYIFRAYHALPALTRRSDNMPVGAVQGFCNMLWKLLNDAQTHDKPTHFACIFDKSAYSFRNEIYPEYKAHRPPAPEDLVPQFPLVREAARAFGCPAIEMEGYEADDLIATYARQAEALGAKVTIISSDKDLMQLVSDNISLLDTMKNRHLSFDAVQEKFGVAPKRVTHVQALAGDSVDNIPGAPGIGVKTAAELINTYGSLEELLARAEDIKQPKRRQTLIDHAEAIRISYKLVTLDTEVPVEAKLEDFILKGIDPQTLMEFLQNMEFRSLTQRVRDTFKLAKPEDVQVVTDTGFDLNAYPTITNMAQLHDWIGRIYKTGYMAIDTETTGLNIVSADLVGISLALAPNEACYIPLDHKSRPDGELNLGHIATPGQIPKREVLEALAPVLADPTVLKIGQNLKYDISILARHDIEVKPYDDTMLMSHCLYGGLHNHGMDELAQRYLDHTPIAFKDIAGTGKSQITFDLVPLDQATRYAAEDADITLRLWLQMRNELAKKGVAKLYERIERPLPFIVSHMEREGICVNRHFLSQLSTEFARNMQIFEEEAYQLAGRAFNLGSPKQIGEILFGELKLPGGKKTKTGAWSTGADTLDQLANDGHALPRTLLQWRLFQKLKSTYTDALIEAINPVTGRVHTSFSLTGASTGRLSSTDPNLQNIPIRTEEGRKIRKAFIAKPGHKLISADYSQVELRILAHIAGIDTLCDAFRSGADIHAMTASEIFNTPIEGMDPMIRRQAKAINFGIIYGISAFGLSNQLGVRQSEARDYIAAYFEKFPGIRDYMSQMKAIANANGYVQTAFGRRVWVKGIKEKNPAQRAFAERQAINAPIQGSAADIIKRAMCRIPYKLKETKLNAKMLLQVHDELVFEAPENEVEQTKALICEVMADAASPVLCLSVPLVVEAEHGDNWADAH